MSGFTNPQNSIKKSFDVYFEGYYEKIIQKITRGNGENNIISSNNASTGERIPLNINKSFDLIPLETEQPKFTQENAMQILREIVEIIRDKRFCNNDDFVKILETVYKPALQEKVMRNIRRGKDGHYEFNIEEALSDRYDVKIFVLPKRPQDKYNNEFCYFVFKGQTPEFEGPPIRNKSWLNFLNF
jgi:hypothetical protein